MNKEQGKRFNYILQINEDCKLDMVNGIIKNKNVQQHLNQKEAGMLCYLFTNRNTSISYKEIYKVVWGVQVVLADDEASARNIGARLKNKLKNIGLDSYFRSVRGYGFMWEEDIPFSDKF